MAQAVELPWTAIAIRPNDDVAVALTTCAPGEIRVRVAGVIESLTVRESVELGHKIALREIAAGGLVRKYGEVIGEASADIARGAHVHVHNLRSRRARADHATPTSSNSKPGRKQ